jgi:predicted DNA-binding protein
MKPKRFGNVLPVRLPADTDKRLKRIAKAVGISKSDALRMAINHGLPNLEAGRISLQTEVEAA